MSSSLKHNIVYNFGYQLLILALPLVTAPYLSRVVGAEGIGIYSYSYAIATYFTYLTMLGLNNYGNRTIAACQNDKDKRTKAFWSIYAMQVCCFAISGGCYAAYTLIFAEDTLIALLQGLYVLSALFDINWFFFGMEKFKLTVIRNTVVKLLTTALIFLLVRDSSDIPIYIGIMCSGFLASQLVLWPFLRKYVSFYKPTRQDVVIHIRPNLVLFVSVIAISVYNVLSRILLGSLSGPEAVGFFDNAAKLVSVPTALIAAVGTVMLPRTSALLSQGNTTQAQAHTDKTMLAVMAFSGIAAFGIPCIAFPFVEVFYGTGFEESASALIILCATIPLLGFGNVMRTQFLIPRKMDSVFLASAICGAVASLVVNIALIPSFGTVGGAFASVAAEAAVLIYQAIRVRREFPLKRYCFYAIAFLFCGVIMACFLSFVPSSGGALQVVAAKVGIGIAAYTPLATLSTLVIKRLSLKGKPMDHKGH